MQVHKFKKQGIDVLAKNGGTYQYNSQLYVLPKEHISVAVIFAGHADPTAVTDAILQALLEEKGMVERPSADLTLPGDAEVPDSFKNIEGLYASELGVVKLEINTDKSGFTILKYDGKGFKPAGVLTYKENGRFYRPDGINFSFHEHGKRKIIKGHFDGSDAGIVLYEGLNSSDGIDTGVFPERVWVPLNLDPNVFFCYNGQDPDNS